MDPHPGSKNAVVDGIVFAEELVHHVDHELGGHFGLGHGHILAGLGVRLGVGFGGVLGNLDRELLLLGLHAGDPIGGDVRTRLANGESVGDLLHEFLAGGVHEEGVCHLLGILRFPDIDVDDSSPSLAGGLAGLGDVISDVASDAIVEPATNVDDQIRFLHEEIGSGVAVHAHHVEGEGVSLVEAAQRVEGGAHRDLQCFGQVLQLLGRVVAALPRDDDGFLGGADQRHQLLHQGGLTLQWPLLTLGVEHFKGGDVIIVEFLYLPHKSLLLPWRHITGLKHVPTIGPVVHLEPKPLLHLPEVQAVPNPHPQITHSHELRAQQVLSIRHYLQPHRNTFHKLFDRFRGNHLILQILRQIQKRRSGPAACGHVERVIQRHG
mmetsp:Transcript_28510/g.34798  ORF Transcript_28510/g.34798 Transcript_28510/m.34798 type:complete len:378 (-) Transcript_28510:1048-2181(-)